MELNFAGISDEIPIKLENSIPLLKLTNVVKISDEHSMIHYNTTVTLDKYVEKRKVQEFKTFYITFILYDLSEQDTLIDQSIKPTETIRVIIKLDFRKHH